MSKEQQKQEQAPGGSQQSAGQPAQSQQGTQTQQGAQADTHPDFDALANKKPEELTPEELRLMADTMPGEGPGD